ncbi:MAG: hypothetical protein U9O78_04765 [Patescibacteria group bacterium]|nr:hypothetical protein [Patescibacteria group bacterium]
MKKNTLTYLVIFLSLAFAGGAVGMLINNKDNLLKNKESTPTSTLSVLGEKKKTKSEYDEMASQIIACMDNRLKNEDGIYYSNLICDQNDNCDPVFSNRSSTPPIWAKFKYAKLHQDQEMFDSLLTDAKNVKDNVNTIQNVFWNCKFVAEVMDDFEILRRAGIITTKEKQLITLNLCIERNTYFYGKITEGQEKSVPDEPIQFNLQELATALENPDYQGKFVLAMEDPNFVTFLPSEYLAKYWMTHQEEDLKKSNFFFHQALELVKKQHQTMSPAYICMVGETSLDYFRLFEDKYYLELAKTLYNNTNIKPDSLKTMGILDQAVCGRFVKGMATLTKENDYYLHSNQIMTNLIQNHRDNSGCFVDGLNTSEKEVPIYANSLIVDLLLESQDE